MKISTLVPWQPGCEWRERAWQHVAPRLPGEVITGASPPGPFSRTAAILDAAGRASGDVYVVSDADVLCDLDAALDHVSEHGWAIPHRLIHRLSRESTEKVYDGADWHGLPLSTDNLQDRRPYVGHEAGTLYVITAEAFWTAPPDPGFKGWGGDDDALKLAYRCLIGAPWRGDADLVHLWHPPQPRDSRVRGNAANMKLLKRYQRAARDRNAMRALVDSARRLDHRNDADEGAENGECGEDRRVAADGGQLVSDGL